MCLSLKGKKNELVPLDWLFFIKKGLIFWVCLFFAVFELIKLYVDYDDTEIYGKIFKYSLIYMTKFVLLCVGCALLFKDEEYIPQGNKNPLLDMRS